MTYTKKQFLEDVKKEAVALKKHATKEEIAKLDFEGLDPLNKSHCIYGQATGHCRSDRAIELIEKCCIRFIKLDVMDTLDMDPEEPEAWTAIKLNVNGKSCAVKPLRELVYISSIETYIATPSANNEELIDFLKGNRKDLVL